MTGLLLAGAFLFAVIHPNSIFFYSFSAFALLIAAWEWAGLCSPRRAFRFFFLPVVAFLMIVAFYAVHRESLTLQGMSDPIAQLLLLSIPLWLAFLLAVTRFPGLQAYWNNCATKAFSGLLVLTQGWLALLFLREHSNASIWIIFVIALVALSDIGAYFSGRRFGLRKLAVHVSPGKTWEGFCGGMAAALVLGIAVVVVDAGQFFGELKLLHLLAVVVLVSAISVLGDLSLSMLKRVAGLKDSGSILPGHGGVLDRIDGMLAAVPVFACMMWLFGW